MVKCRYVLVSIAFHVLNILGQCFRSQCLTIDNRIAVIENDCYTRISVGSKLSEVDIISRAEVAGLEECEEQCSQSERICNSFMFGVGLKGNGTCALSTRIPDLKNLEIDPDYDVYVKNQENSPWCNVIHSYGHFFIHKNRNSSIEPDKRLNTKGYITFTDDSSSLKTTKPVSSSQLRTLSIPRDKDGKPNQKPVNIYDLFINHDGRFLSGDDSHRILDILANKNEKKISSNTFGESLNISLYRATDIV